MTEDDVDTIAGKVREALDCADLERFADLLDPNVTWGVAGGDPAWGCHNRKQVLAWYANGREQGRRARVLDVATSGNRILITMKVSSPEEDGEVDRWQVLTVTGGRVSDIRGYDDEAQARSDARIAE
jgi:ketosteroid isomerase-like protein